MNYLCIYLKPEIPSHPIFGIMTKPDQNQRIPAWCIGWFRSGSHQWFPCDGYSSISSFLRGNQNRWPFSQYFIEVLYWGV